MTAQIIAHEAWRKAAKRRSRRSDRVIIRPGSVAGTFNVQIEPEWKGASNFDEYGVTLNEARAHAKKIGKWLLLAVVDLSDGYPPPRGA